MLCSITYCEEQPEWMMEKNRYYCELPGDVWEQGTFMELILENQEQRVRAGVAQCDAVSD